MLANTSIPGKQTKKLKEGDTSQCLTSITQTEEHSIELSPKPPNQLTAEKNLYPATSVTRSTLPTAKTTGRLISNTPDSPKNTQENLALVKSNYPAEQFIDKKKYLFSSSSCSSQECIPTAIYITTAVKASELLTVFGTKNTSETSTGEKKTTSGSKPTMTHTTQTKQTLTSRSKSGDAIRKNENPVTTHQEHPGNKQLITPHNNSRETEHVKDPTKQVQVENLNTVSTTEPQAENKENGKKKKKRSTLKRTDGSPNTKKKKLTEEGTDVDKKNTEEEEISVTVGQNHRETWTNLFASVSKHLKTCNERTEIKPMKFKVLNILILLILIQGKRYLEHVTTISNLL